MKNLIVIIGPTGVGKTELCLQLAEHYGCEIINADSRQIYKEIPIGTAAPTAEQQQRVRHYFVASHSIGDYYSASMYEQEVLALINEKLSEERDAGIENEKVEDRDKEKDNGKDKDNTHPFAILSGGSMMYIDAVCNGIDEIPTIRDDIREMMKQRMETEGLESLVEELHQLDPQHWEIVDKKNPRRVLHALEICHQTGNTYTSYRTNGDPSSKTRTKRNFGIIKIGLNRPREELYERINARVLQMVDEGLEQEARSVYHLRSENALNTVGFKEMFSFFDGAISKDEAVRQIQSNTRRYARKQLTWYKCDQEMTWFAPENIKEIIKFIDEKCK